MFGWFSKNRMLEIEEGKGGKWRWYARVDGDIVAQSGIKGHLTKDAAKEQALTYLKSSWPTIVRMQGGR